MKNIITVVLLSLTNLAHAAGVGDPFAKVTSKLTETTTLLGGTIAVAVISLAVTVCGYLVITHKMRAEFAYRIIGGAAIIAAASAIAGYAMA